jgi:hypothetical protein
VRLYSNSDQRSETPRRFGFRCYRGILSGLGEPSRYRTPCGLDGPGFEPKWSKKFYLLYICPYLPCVPPSPLYNGYRGLSGVKRPWRGVHYPPPSNTEVKYAYSYTTSPPLCASYDMLRGDRYFHLGLDSGLVQMLPIKFLQKNISGFFGGTLFLLKDRFTCSYITN